MAIATVLFASAMILFVATTVAVVLKVGDSQGWSVGRVNYDEWSSSNKFYVGDTIVFEYSPTHHNVIQVAHRDYILCRSTSSPIAAYLSGNDEITFNKSGEYFYFCSWPGHCEAGQKVSIRVLDPPIASPPANTTSLSTESAPLVPPAPVYVPAPAPAFAPLDVDIVIPPETSPSASVEPTLVQSNSLSLYSLRTHVTCLALGLVISIASSLLV